MLACFSLPPLPIPSSYLLPHTHPFSSHPPPSLPLLSPLSLPPTLPPTALGVPPALGTDNGDLTIVSAAFSPNGPCPLDGSSTPSSDSTYAPTTPVADVKTPDGYELGDITNA